MRFLGYTLANEAETPTEPPRPELYEEMGTFVEEAVNAGVIVATGGIGPTSEGAKITLKDGEFTVVDGPFAEAKELVGGWALMECRDRDEAIEWSKRFVTVLGEGEVRIRPSSDRAVADRDAVVESVACRPPIRPPAVEAVFRIEFPRVVAAAGGLRRRHRAGRGPGPGRAGRRPAPVAPGRHPRNPGAWLTDRRQAQGHRPLPPGPHAERRVRRAGRELESAMSRPPTTRSTPTGVRRGDRRRPTPPDLRGLPSGVAGARPTSLTLRLVGGLTVPRSPGPMSCRNRRSPSASSAPRRRSPGPACPSRSRRERTGRPAWARARGDLPHLQRGLLGHLGRGLAAARALREALRLGRVLAALAPQEPEVHGLVALMEFQSSRLRARTGPVRRAGPAVGPGSPHLGPLHINRGEAALARAELLGETRGPYTLQAAIAACHARSFRPEDTDWARRRALRRARPRRRRRRSSSSTAPSRSPWPRDRTRRWLVDQLVDDGHLDRYHLLSSVRGDLLDRLGRHAEAAAELSAPPGWPPTHGERRPPPRSAPVPAGRGAAAADFRRHDVGGSLNPPLRRPAHHGRNWSRAGGSVRRRARPRPRAGRRSSSGGSSRRGSVVEVVERRPAGSRVTDGWVASSSPTRRLAYSSVSGSAIPAGTTWRDGCSAPSAPRAIASPSPGPGPARRSRSGSHATRRSQPGRQAPAAVRCVPPRRARPVTAGRAGGPTSSRTGNAYASTCCVNAVK